MMKLINPKLLNANLIRRFSSSRCNPTFYQTDKMIKQLVQQNKFLKDIDLCLTLITINMGVITGLTVVTMAFK
jgi:hypothetical protein